MNKYLFSPYVVISNFTICKVLNSEYIKATIEVKQGGPMSCLMFIIYRNVLASMLKSIGDDSYLVDIHGLMLMDDTYRCNFVKNMVWSLMRSKLK